MFLNTDYNDLDRVLYYNSGQFITQSYNINGSKTLKNSHKTGLNTTTEEYKYF